METNDIRLSLDATDRTVKSLWNEILDMTNRVNDCREKAEQLENRAAMILNSILVDEDPSSKISEAQMYQNKAQEYENMAYDYEMIIDSNKKEMRNYISEYNNYKSECERNIANIETSINILMEVKDSRYNKGMNNLLKEFKQKITINKKYYDCCISRITSIEQICGSDNNGDRQKYNVKKKR